MVQKEKKPNKYSRWFGSHTSAFLIIIIATILLTIAGIFLYKNLKNTKVALESCRSSCSSSE